MGGQLIKGYSIEGDSLCHVGLTKSWKLYKGHNSSTHTSASIFLIEKKQLKKNDRQEIIKFAKKQSTSLLRVRHPGVLAVIQPLTQDQNILAFVAEKIQGNFSLLIKQNKLQEFITSQLQLKLFLYPFIETIIFIHDALKQTHLEISFDNIFVTAVGKWKLAGFGHNQQTISDELAHFDQKITDFSFSAPEVALQQCFCKKSDNFSLGLVILRLLEFIHQTNKPPGSCPDKNQYQKVNKDTKTIASHPIITKSNNPTQLSEFMKGLLNWDHTQRSRLSDLLYSGWMNDSTLMTMKYLDKINNYESKQQLDFLKGLAGVLDDFPSRVTNRIVVPKLLDLLKFNHLIASIIYIMIDLLKKKKIEEPVFKKTVWPSLKAVTQGKQMTAQAIYLLVINIQIFEKNVSEADITSHLMPLYLKCYDCPPKLKQLALSMLEKISKKIEYQFIKTKIIPKLMGLLKDPNIDIRKDALKGLYSILHLIDNQTVSLSILPGLETARKAGSDPFVNAIITHMHKKLGQSLPIEILSSKILPTLIPYLTEPSLSKAEFLQFKSLIFQMVQRIERESSKQFDNNSLQNLHSTFGEADFKFKEADTKPTQTKKGDYNFLTSYLEPKTENSTSTVPEAKNPYQEMPQAGGFNFPQTTTTPLQTPAYNFDTFSSGLSNNIYSPPVTTLPIHTEQNQKVLEKNNSYINTDIFQNLEAKKQFQQIKQKGQKVIQNPKFYSRQIPQVPTQPVYLPPSPPKEQIAKKKFVGGTSGPMQIKKLKGPPPPSVKPQKSIDSPPKSSGFQFNFEKKKEEKAFSMNFGNISNLQMGPNSSTEKKDSTSYSGSFNFDSNKLSSKFPSSDNPFEEIQTANAAHNPFQGTSMTMNKGGNLQDADIYSYFSSDPKPPQSSAPKDSFDLI